MRYDPDPVEHEQRVLELVKEWIAGDSTLGDMGGTRVPTIFHDIRLEGSFPDTKLVIDMARGNEYRDTREWNLWGDSFGGLPDDMTAAPPEEVLVQVSVIVYEF